MKNRAWWSRVMKNPFVLGVAATLLGGCAGSVIEYATYDPTYKTGEHLFAGAGSDLNVTVAGSPFGLPQPQFADVVTGAMQGAYTGGYTRFVASSGPPQTAYHVYMVFDPAPGIGDSAICVNPSRPLSADTAPVAASGAVASGRTGSRDVELVAVLCRGNRPMSSATGYLTRTAGPATAEFRDGIAHFTYALFPTRNPSFDGNGNDIPTP